MGTAPSTPFEEQKLMNVKKDDDINLVWEANCAVNGKWKKENQLVEKSERITIKRSKDQKHFTLTIKKAREQDEGKYTLEIWNIHGRASGSITVKLLEFDKEWRTINWNANEKVKKDLREFKISNPEVKQLRFLLHGQVGGGKSSVVNSISSVFQGRIQEKAGVNALFSKSYTTNYTTYDIIDQSGIVLPFVFNDMMGQESTSRGMSTSDVINAIKGHVKEGYKFKPEPLSEGDEDYVSNPNLNDQAHCLVTVISANTIKLQNEDNPEDIISKIKDIRRQIRDMDFPQVVFLTNVDVCCEVVNCDLKRIYSSKKIHNLIKLCNNKLGIPMTSIFPVKNYHEENEVKEEIDSLMLNALVHTAHRANDYMRKKTK